MDDKIKILYAEDHITFRKAMISFLKKYSQLEVIGEANTGKEAIAFLKHTHADIVLLDIEMPVMNGVDALKIIAKDHQDSKVIIMSSYSGEELNNELLRLGAKAFVPKSLEPEKLVEIIIKVNAAKKKE